jgi:alpha-tubulin suppressor-like RCC1 family protein
MRARLGFATGLVAAAFLGVAACGFGVDLDNLFGASGDGGGAGDGSLDGGDGGLEAGIPSVEVQQLAAGDNYTCGRRVDGTVMCWGEDNPTGRLGDGLKFSSSVPVLVKDVTDAIDVAAGPNHACVIHKTGTVSCWGDNDGRQLGDGTTTGSPTPLNVVQLVDAQQLALGEAFSCAVKKDATVHCWGDNSVGQLGDGTMTPRSQPAPVSGVAGAKQVAAIDQTACALTQGGEVLCWGHNNEGQAGQKPPTNALVPAKVASLAGVTSIGLGGSGNFCAVLQSGAVMCWGSGNYGNLGNSKTEPSEVPVAVISIADAVGVTVGGGHGCAWRKSGAVACWGLNDWRQLGIGDTTTTTTVSTPLPVEALTGVKQVAAGGHHTCALLTDGKHISCWGANVGGTLGRGTRVVSDVPIKVATSASIASLALGASHSCAIDGAGALQCWGSNELRQYLEKTLLASGAPTIVAEATGVARAAAGDGHTCVSNAAGQVQCWGGGQYGNLGNANAAYIETAPVTFITPAGAPATDLGAGYFVTCALLGNKEIACTGLVDSLRLGSGTGGNNISTPALITAPGAPAPVDAGAEAGPPPPPALGATKMSAGGGHSCALRGGGIATCWGSNGNGECGVGGPSATLPVDVPTLTGLTDIAAGGGHTCAVLGDGSVRCWGANDHGQVTGGMGNSPTLRTPDLGGKTAKAVTAGSNHSCALATDGTVLCWGKGTSGQLGNGVRADATTPVVVKNLATTVKAVYARQDRSCALLDDGSAFCWGKNRIGELGDGAVMSTGAGAPVVGY